RADESIPELIQEVQGAAQKCHMSPDGFSAGQSADGLVDNSLEDGGGQIFPGGTFIDQRLDVRLGKHAAAGSDGVEGLVILCVLVETGGVCLEQGSHLVDEGAGTAGTHAVHALLNAAALKVDDLCILAAKL